MANYLAHMKKLKAFIHLPVTMLIRTLGIYKSEVVPSSVNTLHWYQNVRM